MPVPAPLLPAYLIVGSDELKREGMVKRLKSRVPSDFVDFNLDEFEARSVEDPVELQGCLETMPFGCDFRLVIIQGAETLAKPVSERVISYLQDPNPSCVLCLVAEKLAKNTRLYKAVAKVGPKAIVDCSPMKRWELAPHLVRLAQKRGLTLDADAAEQLVERAGESTVMLDNLIATLGELVAPETHITRADVEANVAQTAEVSPWAFADSVCERNAPRAMELLGLMREPSEVFLLSVLVGRLRELVCAQSLAARGTSSRLASELGKAPWQVKNHGRWARRFSPGELTRLLGSAASCERAVKGSADSKTAFWEFVLEFCGAVPIRDRSVR